MDAYGLVDFLIAEAGVEDLDCTSRAAACGFGAPAAACAENGLRNMLFGLVPVGVFAPELGGVEVLRPGIGLALRVAG